MRSCKITLILAGALTLLASACVTSAPTPQPFTVADAASTLVASTFQAATRSAALHTPTPFPSPAATATGAKPLLYLNDNANCRTGTNPNFKLVAALIAGTTVELVARDTPQSAWLVRVPNSTDVCWVLAQDGSPTGDFQNLPEVTPQSSTQNPPLPLNKGSIIANFACSYPGGSGESVTTTLSWYAPTDANGYHIFRGDTQIADLPASTITYKDTAIIVPAGSVTYGISVYNDVGESAQTKITIHCNQ